MHAVKFIARECNQPLGVHRRTAYTIANWPREPNEAKEKIAETGILMSASATDRKRKRERERV